MYVSCFKKQLGTACFHSKKFNWYIMFNKFLPIGIYDVIAWKYGPIHGIFQVSLNHVSREKNWLINELMINLINK